jgi:hypothetical protein
MTNSIKTQISALVAAMACFILFAPSAAACDHTRMLTQMRGVQQKSGPNPSPLRPSQPIAEAPVFSQTGRAGIVGMWQVSDYYQGQLFDEYFDTWHTDGNELFIDAVDPIEDNVCQGIWTATSANNYKLKHQAWNFDQNGNLLGWVIFRAHIQLGGDGNSYSGTENIYVYDTNGNLIEEFDGAVLQATRISVDF